MSETLPPPAHAWTQETLHFAARPGDLPGHVQILLFFRWIDHPNRASRRSLGLGRVS